MNLKKTLYWIGFLALAMSAVAFANEGAPAVAGDASGAYAKLGATLALGIAAFGGAYGQSKAAAAALDGIARNPAAAGKIFMPMIVGLALIESLVLYAFVIAFMTVGK